MADGSLLDRESSSSYSITVMATGSDGSTSSQTFTVNLTDADEFDVGPVIDLDMAANAVSENAANGTLVGVVTSASDADSTNNTVTYALSDSAGGRFAIHATTGVVTVADGTLLDAETAATHTITVIATSADGSSSSQSFSINIADANESTISPVMDTNATANTVAENSANGSLVGITASAIDADLTNNAISYALSDNAGGRFGIDSVTGSSQWPTRPCWTSNPAPLTPSRSLPPARTAPSARPLTRLS